MAKSELVFDVTEADFEEKVVRNSHTVPVVVDCWAPWCGPCRSLGPILEAAVAKRNGAVLLAKLNVDEAQNLAMQFRIESIPHVIAFRKGQAVVEFVGLLQEAQLTDFFDRLKPTDAEKEAEAAGKLENTDPAKAETMYRLALKNNPQQQDAIVGLARVLIGVDKDKDAADLLEQIGSAGPFGVEADRLRASLWLRQQAKDLPGEDMLREKIKANPKDGLTLCDLACVLGVKEKTVEALDLLLQAGRVDRKLISTRVKETMVKIFFMIGVRSELADAYRDKLTALLY